jgi:glutamate:GABA antiporter
VSAPAASDPKAQLPRVMGLWDVLLFNVAAVLGPRWIAAAAHNGPSSIILWILAAVGFFLPTALVVVELSSRFPEEGGLYAWAKDAFGDFHGFVAGWTYWIYSVFYFPALLMASTAMSAYVIGPRGAELAQNRTFLLIGSFVLLGLAVVLNIVGLNIGKWLQNAGGVGTYLPMVILVVVAFLIWLRHGAIDQISWRGLMPHWDWDTVNFWPQLAFAFTGLEMAAMMSEEIHDPRRTIPRAVFGSGISIAAMYIIGTVGVLMLIPTAQVDPKSGMFQAITSGSGLLRIGFVGILAALLVSAGNAGGIGTTVAATARLPFVVGIDRYLPPIFGQLHPRWKTPYVSILVQAGFSAIVLLLIQVNQTVNGAYQILVDATTAIYFISLLYMYAAAIKLAYRKDRNAHPNAVLIPGGKAGVWLAGSLGFLVVLAGILLSLIPPGEATNKWVFEAELILCIVGSVFLGLVLYYRGARAKAQQQVAAQVPAR